MQKKHKNSLKIVLTFKTLLFNISLYIKTKKIYLKKLETEN